MVVVVVPVTGDIVAAVVVVIIVGPRKLNLKSGQNQVIVTYIVVLDFVYCQAQFQLTSTSKVQFQRRLCVKPVYYQPTHPPGKAEIQSHLDYLGS